MPAPCICIWVDMSTWAAYKEGHSKLQYQGDDFIMRNHLETEDIQGAWFITRGSSATSLHPQNVHLSLHDLLEPPHMLLYQNTRFNLVAHGKNIHPLYILESPCTWMFMNTGLRPENSFQICSNCLHWHTEKIHRSNHLQMTTMWLQGYNRACRVVSMSIWCMRIL